MALAGLSPNKRAVATVLNPPAAASVVCVGASAAARVVPASLLGMPAMTPTGVSSVAPPTISSLVRHVLSHALTAPSSEVPSLALSSSSSAPLLLLAPSSSSPPSSAACSLPSAGTVHDGTGAIYGALFSAGAGTSASSPLLSRPPWVGLLSPAAFLPSEVVPAHPGASGSLAGPFPGAHGSLPFSDPSTAKPIPAASPSASALSPSPVTPCSSDPSCGGASASASSPLAPSSSQLLPAGIHHLLHRLLLRCWVLLCPCMPMLLVDLAQAPALALSSISLPLREFERPHLLPSPKPSCVLSLRRRPP